MFGADAIRDVVKESAGGNPYHVKKLLDVDERGFLNMVYGEVGRSITGLRRSIFNWPTAGHHHLQCARA
jgi:hypothetical protein